MMGSQPEEMENGVQQHELGEEGEEAREEGESVSRHYSIRGRLIILACVLADTKRTVKKQV
jgi:hypothetical protein